MSGSALRYVYRQTHCALGGWSRLWGGEGGAYKEGDIKFLEFCGVAWRASRDGGLLQLLGRERVVTSLETLVCAVEERGEGLKGILKTHLRSRFTFCFNNN